MFFPFRDGYWYSYFVMLYHWSSDRSWMEQEAERRECRIKSIHYSWFWFYNGPFAGELLTRYTRVYWLECRTKKKKSRIAYVVVGPRHHFEMSEQLTWRWEDWR